MSSTRSFGEANHCARSLPSLKSALATGRSLTRSRFLKPNVSEFVTLGGRKTGYLAGFAIDRKPFRQQNIDCGDIRARFDQTGHGPVGNECVYGGVLNDTLRRVLSIRRHAVAGCFRPLVRNRCIRYISRRTILPIKWISRNGRQTTFNASRCGIRGMWWKFGTM